VPARALDVTGLDMAPADLEAVTSVDVEEWRDELPDRGVVHHDR
jgi:GTP-dependent phosphoenolpyruvate carboxykinase